MRALGINRATELISLSFSVVVSVSLLFTLYQYILVLSDSRSMADAPRELDRVNSILLTDDVLVSGPRTPWSPIRGLTGRRPGPIAATRLLDLEDEGFERPAEYSGRGAATGSTIPLRFI